VVGDLPDSLFREAWEVASDGLVWFDINGKVRACDRKFARLVAAPVTDAAIERIFPAGCQPLQLLDAANPAAGRFCELTIGDGRRLPVRIECVRVQDGLLVALRIGPNRNPGNGKTWLDAVLNATDAVIVVRDREGRFVRFNRAAEALTGYSAAEAIGKDACDLVLFDEDREATRAALEQFMVRPEGILRRESRWRKRDGSARMLSWCNTVTRDSAGNVEYLVSTGIDVTAVRKTEGALASLSGEFIEAQAAARHDICSYLHDTISQNLLVLALSLGDLDRQPDRDTAAIVKQALCLVNRCCQELRVITYALAPPVFDDGDPAAAFEWYCRHLREDARIDVEIRAGAIPPDTSPDVRALLLAALQEWSQKAIRYPAAGKTVITLKKVALANAMSELQLEVLCSQPENEAVRALLASPVIRERVQKLGGRCEAIRQNGGMSARISVNAAGVRT
jgi:PAS domain S-box-containing protein